MGSQTFYLRQNVQLEPLFNQWYAVSLCVPPATGAMFVANSHLKIMRSYVLSPEMHAAASRDPAMIGGPYINYPEPRVAEVQALLDRTSREQAPAIQLAEALKALDQMLRREAKGYSLEPLYAKVPEPLKGYVELVYDLNHQPSFRLIEPLLYRSRHYRLSSQSIGLSLVTRDHRPFVLSTPRLGGGDYLHLRLPFGDEAIDELFRMRHAPRSFVEIAERLGLGRGDEELFKSFLTEEEPAAPAANKYRGEGARVRYFGHACLLIETAETSVLTDPFMSYRYESDLPRFTFADLPEVIDYVMITHGHLDHLLLETLLQLRHRVGQIIVPRSGGGGLADPSLRLLLREVGFTRVVELGELESLPVPGGAITSLPFMGEHHDLDVRGKAAYLVSLAGKRICVAADSCNLEPQLCRHLREACGEVDVLFLGMECDGAPLSWFYGPLLTRPLERDMDYSRQGSACNHRRAIGMAADLNCRQVYVYAMGLEPWLGYVLSINCHGESVQIVESNNFIADCRGRGIHAERLFGQKTIFLPGGDRPAQ